jgi:hypothetical protein
MDDPSGIVGTEGSASAGVVGDEVVAYRVDMHFLISSSTRDLRTFFSGLDSSAAGFGPLQAEAFLRRDTIVVESVEQLSPVTGWGLGRRRSDENILDNLLNVLLTMPAKVQTLHSLTGHFPVFNFFNAA